MKSHSIVIERPIGDVFDVLTSVELTARWFPAPVEEWWTSEPHGVGSTRRASVRVLGRRLRIMRLVGALALPAYEGGWARGLARLKQTMESGEL